MAGDKQRSELAWTIEPWVKEFRDYVKGEMSTEQFVAFYDHAFRLDEARHSDEVFDQLSELWAAADDYEPDPDLRPHVYRSTEPAELRAQVRSLLETAGYEVPDSAK